MSDPVVQEIKSRLDIVPFIQGYVKLTRAGVNWKGNCPFHSEKTPSFMVSPTRQTWRCFGCSKGGDAFSFLMEFEHIDFPEALKILAERTGVELKREDPRERSARERLYAVMEDATKFYEAQLKRVPAVLEYLKRRGLKPETIAEFRIGYAPEGWSAIAEYLKSRGYTADEFVGSGLGIKSEKRLNSYYDRFRNRIMFPIMDSGGRPVGFSGRIFERGVKSDEPKYVNSPQTLVFDKSRILYAFDKAKEAIRKKNRCVIVEGQMDVVMSHQAGVKEAVAVSGTALTHKHLEAIKRIADTLISSFDSDQAGETATRRSLDLAAEFDFVRKVAIIPKGKDPADAVQEDPAVWEQAVEESTSIMDFFYDRAKKKYDLKTPESKKEFSRFLLPEVAKLGNEIERAHWVSQIAAELGVKEDAVWAELRRQRTKIDEPAGSHVESKKQEKLRTHQLEERILGALFLYPVTGTYLKDQDLSLVFENELHRQIAVEGLSSGPEKAIERLPSLPDQWKQYLDHVMFEVEWAFSNVKDANAEIASCIREVERERFRERLSALSDAIQNAERNKDEENLQKLLASFKAAMERLRQLETSGMHEPAVAHVVTNLHEETKKDEEKN